MLSDNRSSSPDPIALPPSPLRRTPRTINSAPLPEGSPNRQLVTPSKSIAFNTPASDGSSPWKIKVTVEAEPYSQTTGAENASPAQNAYSRSRSTKIPLRDDDDSPRSKSKRGRAKKPGGTPTRGRKRNGTPARRRRSKDQEDEETDVAQSTRNPRGAKADLARYQEKQKKNTISSMFDTGDSDSLEDVCDPLSRPCSINKGQQASTPPSMDLGDLHTYAHPDNNATKVATSRQFPGRKLERLVTEDERGPMNAPVEDTHDEPEHTCLMNEPDSGECAPGDETVCQSEGFSFVSIPSLHHPSEQEKNTCRIKGLEDHPTNEHNWRQSQDKTIDALDQSRANLLAKGDMPSVPDFSSLKSTPIHGKTIKTEPGSSKGPKSRLKPSWADTSSIMPSSPPIPIVGLPSRSKGTPLSDLAPFSLEHGNRVNDHENFGEGHDQSRHLLTPEDTDASDGATQSSPHGRIIYPTLPRLDERSPIPNPALDRSFNTPPPISEPTSPATEGSDELSRTQVLELQWQQERAAVSRQIDEANTSQVIIIDSDEEDEENGQDGQDERDGLEQADLEVDGFEEDDPEQDDIEDGDQEDDEDEANCEDREDTGFFFQRNLPTVFEPPRGARKEDSVSPIKTFGRKDKHSGQETGIYGTLKAKPFGMPLDRDSLESGSEAKPIEATENHEGILDEYDDGPIQDKDLVFIDDSEKFGRRQPGPTSTHFPPQKFNNPNLRSDCSLATVLESDEDASEQESETDLSSHAELNHSQNEPTAASSGSGPPSKKAVQQTESSRAIDPGLLARLGSFIWSSLSWSAPPRPQLQPGPPQTPPQKKNTFRTQALQQKYGRLSRYEPWSLPHYRILDRMHYRKKLDLDYFRYYPRTPKRPQESGEQGSYVLDASLQRLVGHTISRNGFNITFMLADVHVIAAYLELLVEPELRSDEEAREQAVRAPGKFADDGDVIGVDMVALRLFGLHAGDIMRREEALGLREPPKRNID